MPEFRGTRHVKPEVVVDTTPVLFDPSKYKFPVAKVGIKETVDLLELLQPCANVAGEILGRRFGLLSVKRLWQAWKLWRRAKAAIHGIGGVPKEVADLDLKEKQELAMELGAVVQEFFVGFYGGKVVNKA